MIHFRQKVLIIRLSAIGDVVLSTGALRCLLGSFEEKNIFFLGSKPSLELIKESYPKINFYEISEAEKCLQELPFFDYVFDLQRNLKSYRFLRKLRLELKLGKVYSIQKSYLKRWMLLFRSRLRKRTLLPEKTKRELIPFQFQRMQQCLNEALSFDQNKLNEFTPKLNVKETSSLLRELGRTHRILAVAPCASYETKKAPKVLFYDTITLLRDSLEESSRKKLVVLLLGSLEEKKEVMSLFKSLKEEVFVLNFSGQLGLHELPSLLAVAKVLLTNDSGLLHISEAVGTPVAAFFGPTHELFGFSPWLPESQVFSTALSCRPCSRHGKLICRYKDKACFKLIEPDKVALFLSSFFS